MKKTIWNFIGQMIPVMIGVYLGFALNNFGEAQKVKSQAGVYKQMLKNEISQNLEEIKGTYAYHEKLAEDINALAKNEDLKKAFGEFSFKGLQPGLVNDSAYNTGIQTGIIQHFDLEFIQSLNRLYALQKKYDAFNESMISSFLAQKFPETESEIKSMLIAVSMNMNDVLNFEHELEKFYTAILNKLES